MIPEHDWLDAYTLAARRAAKLPDDWHGYQFSVAEPRGVMITGLVCKQTISRGPNAGEPRFRTGDKITERTVFVSNKQADRAMRDLRKADAHAYCLAWSAALCGAGPAPHLMGA